MTQLCETCLTSVAFGWNEVACGDCAPHSLSAVAMTSLDTECVRLIAFGWEAAACSSCRGDAFEAEGLALAA